MAEASGVKSMLYTLQASAARTGWEIRNFHIAPQQPAERRGTNER